jgi:formyltetrahydrofolate deformylase
MPPKPAAPTAVDAVSERLPLRHRSVTAERDQGPIIEQDVRRVGRAHSGEDLILAGRKLECRVPGSGLRAHVEDRDIVCGRRTVIFNR